MDSSSRPLGLRPRGGSAHDEDHTGEMANQLDWIRRCRIAEDFALTDLGREKQLVEDENRRLAEEAKSVQERLDEANKELETQKQQLEPLQLCKAGEARREEDWERTKKVMEAEADEWKALYDSTFTNFQEDGREWNAAKEDLDTRLKNTTEALEQATTALEQLAVSSDEHLAEAVKQRDLRDLGLQRIADLEASLEKSTAEVNQGKEKEAKSLTDRAQITALRTETADLRASLQKSDKQLATAKTSNAELKSAAAAREDVIVERTREVTQLKARELEIRKWADAHVRECKDAHRKLREEVLSLQGQLAEEKRRRERLGKIMDEQLRQLR